MDLLTLFLIVFCSTLGAVLASFFAAQVTRETNPKKSYSIRSQCDHCAHKLSVWDLIPIFSYLFLRGRCRYCHKPIASQFFLSEVIGVIMGGLWGVALSQALVTWVDIPLVLGESFVVILLLYLATYDVLTLTIPAQSLLYLLAATLILNFYALITRNTLLLHLGGMDNVILGLVSGFAVWIIVKLTKEKGLGMGDVYLVSLLAALLGWPRAIGFFYASIFIALGVGLVVAAARRKFHGTIVPLVPCLAIGFLIAFIWGERIFQMLFPTLYAPL